MQKITRLFLFAAMLTTWSVHAQPTRPAGYWRHWGVEDGLPQSDVFSITEDARGIIWIVTQEGLSFLAAGKYYNWNQAGFDSIEIAAPRQVKSSIDKDTIWVFTRSGMKYGIGTGVNSKAMNILKIEKEYFYNDTVGAWKIRPLLKEYGRITINKVFQDDGAQWVATESGLFYIGDAGKPVLYYSGLEIYDLFKSRDGVLWVATERGLFLYSKFGTALSTPGAQVKTSYLLKPFVFDVDPDPLDPNIVWTATLNAGMQKVDIQKDITINLGYEGYTTTWLTNRMWTGSAKGIFLIKNNRPEKKADQGAIKLMFNPYDSLLWVATIDSMICRYAVKGESLILKDRIDLGLFAAKSFLFMKDSSTFIGTANGLYKMPKNTFNLQPFIRKPILNGFISDIQVDMNNHHYLWVAGRNLGLVQYDLKTHHTKVYSSPAYNLPDNTIYAVRQDPAGNLWLSTNHGIVRLNPANETSCIFDYAHDQIPEEYNMGAAAIKNDSLLFGGVGGLLCIYPRYPPKVDAHIYLLVRGQYNKIKEMVPDIAGVVNVTPNDGKLAIIPVSANHIDPLQSTFRFILKDKIGGDTIDMVVGQEYDLPSLSIGFYTLTIRPEGNAIFVGGEKTVDIRRYPSEGELAMLLSALLLIGFVVGIIVYFHKSFKREEYARQLSNIIQHIFMYTRNAKTEDELREALKIGFTGNNEDILKKYIKADVFSIFLREGEHLAAWVTLEDGIEISRREETAGAEAETDKNLRGSDIKYPLNDDAYLAVSCFKKVRPEFVGDYAKIKIRPTKKGVTMRSIIYVPIVDKTLNTPIGVATIQTRTPNTFTRQHVYFLQTLADILTFGVIQQRELERARLELSILTPQMMPHFLSNSFALLSDISVERQKQIDFAKSMSSVSRSWLNAMTDGDGFLRLKEELAFLEEYVYASKMVKGLDYLDFVPLQFEPGMEALADSLWVPVLFFQPYLENSLAHGLFIKYGSDKGRGAQVKMSIYANEEMVSIHLTDNGAGMLPETEAKIRLDEPIGQGRFEAKSVRINKRRVEILNTIYPGPMPAIDVVGPQNIDPDFIRETGVIVKIHLRRNYPFVRGAG